MFNTSLSYPQHHQRRCSRLRTVFVLTGLGLSLAGFSSVIRPAPLLIYNGSASAPIGFYRVLPATAIQRGDLVLVQTPKSVRALAAERGYLPARVNLVKRVVAVNGDTICAINRTISIDGRAVATQPFTDSQGRPLPRWRGCQVLGANAVFLLMEAVPDSFDGRYFGPVRMSSIIGKLQPLWLR